MADDRTGSEKITILCSTDTLDRAFIVFMLANSARSMGLDVNIFFALWGVNLLRRGKNQPGLPSEGDEGAKKRSLMESMMAMMMPRGPAETGLSKMNMGGMGSAMMRSIMKKKGLATLPELMSMSVELGVEFTVCSLTMELMGFKREDLLDLPNITFAGMASFLGSSLDSKFSYIV